MNSTLKALKALKARKVCLTLGPATARVSGLAEALHLQGVCVEASAMWPSPESIEREREIFLSPISLRGFKRAYEPQGSGRCLAA